MLAPQWNPTRRTKIQLPTLTGTKRGIRLKYRTAKIPIQLAASKSDAKTVTLFGKLKESANGTSNVENQAKERKYSSKLARVCQ